MIGQRGQASIYDHGKTPASLPGIDDPKSEFKAANNYTKKLGFRFEPSGVPGNHWSNITTMKSYVRNVLSVYFNKKRTLKRKTQVYLWIVDCWSVHRSQEFRNWMQESYPGFLSDPETCNEGDSVVSHCQGNCHPPDQQQRPRDVLLAKIVGVLRNRSVEWLVNGYNAINKPEVVKKAWELCKVGEINLSYECLTSPEVRQALVGLCNADPKLHEQLSTPLPLVPSAPPPPEDDGPYPEDQEHNDDETFVNSSLSIDEVIAAWIADEAPGAVADWSGDEDEGIDGFGREGSCRLTRFLEPFDSLFATSTWSRWDGIA